MVEGAAAGASARNQPSDRAQATPAMAVGRDARSQPARQRFGPASHPPVVVELFTSQGCSACPPADALLEDLAARPDVMALSYHVDYWDYLGWADELARPEFAARQRAYADAMTLNAIYTPQIVVAGIQSPMEVRPADLADMIDDHRAGPVVISVSWQGGADQKVIRLSPRQPIAAPVAVELIRYAPQRMVKVVAGENHGRTIRYVNVVLDVQRVSIWDGAAPLKLTLHYKDSSTDYPADTRHVLLMQQHGKNGLPGPVLAALRLD